VIVRSSANINAGAVSRWSAVFHGFWILLCVLFLGSVIEHIPLAVLAGLLVHVGVNLVNLRHIRELTAHHEVRVYWATVIGVTCVNLLAGVCVGVAVSVFFAIRRLSSVKVEKRQEGDVWKVSIRGTLNFRLRAEDQPRNSRYCRTARPWTLISTSTSWTMRRSNPCTAGA
jgi:carbonic anhydrase